MAAEPVGSDVLDPQRTFANMARRVIALDADGQNFISDSPWSAAAVLQQVRRKSAATPALRTGGVLLLDESADEKAGAKSAGAGRQHNGRLARLKWVHENELSYTYALSNAAAHTAVERLAELEVPPALSVSNVRLLLQAALPLPQLSPEEAMRLVAKHLVNRLPG